RASARSAGIGQGAGQTALREAAARGCKDHNRRKREPPLRKRSQCRLATQNEHFGCGLVAPTWLIRPTQTSVGERPGNPFATRANARLPQEDRWSLLAKRPGAIEPAVCRAGDLFTEQERWPMESTRPLPGTGAGDREA